MRIDISKAMVLAVMLGTACDGRAADVPDAGDSSADAGPRDAASDVARSDGGGTRVGDAGTVESDGGITAIDAGRRECNLSAGIETVADLGGVRGTGVLRCAGAERLEIEVCLQSITSGAFEDVVCMSRTSIGTDELETEALTGCGLLSDEQYRTRVRGSANGMELAEAVSRDVLCERRP